MTSVQETTAMAGLPVTDEMVRTYKSAYGAYIDEVMRGLFDPPTPDVSFHATRHALEFVLSEAAAPPPATSSAVEALRVTDEMVRDAADVLWSMLDLNGHTNEGVKRTARAVLEAALQAGTEVAVKAGIAVKPLEWDPYRARTPFGFYGVSDLPMANGLYGLRFDGTSLGDFETVKAAKAAAQADYESRIRSALAPVQQAGVESELVERREWLIRKRGYFYRPDFAGYTANKSEAGRYTKAEADAEVANEPSTVRTVHESEWPDAIDWKARAEAAEAALAASEATLARGTPFAYDPATGFFHEDDGGAPASAIAYVPKSEVAASEAKLAEAVAVIHDLDFAVETTLACLNAWNDGRGSPADTDGILGRARSFTSAIQEKGNG